MRELKIEDPLGTLTMQLPDNACVFCKGCSDFFYDYTNGPYLILCEYGNHPNDEGTCEHFIEG